MARWRVGLQTLALVAGLVAAGWLPTSAQAPDGGVITGQVRDGTGALVAGISVALRRDDIPDQSRRFATTAADGTFTFTALRAGTYSLEVRTPAIRAFLSPGRRGHGRRTCSPQHQTERARRNSTGTGTPGNGTGTGPSRASSCAAASCRCSRARTWAFPADGQPEAQPRPRPRGPRGRGRDSRVLRDRPQPRIQRDVDYGSGRSATGRLSLGRFDVSIPRDHQLGNIERPGIWTMFREDPALHFVITRRVLHTYQGFYDDVRSVVAQSTRKDAFVFIHGFNVSFSDAVMRTAQIAYDLGFDGAPILYSWPSNTGESPLGYTAAQNNNDWTIGHLESFLRDVAARTGARRVHLIAHSMGNRALVTALSRLPRGKSRLFSQIVLTAPDIDADTFVELSAAVARSAERTTLYASSSDIALALSKRLHAYGGERGRGLWCQDRQSVTASTDFVDCIRRTGASDFRRLETGHRIVDSQARGRYARHFVRERRFALDTICVGLRRAGADARRSLPRCCTGDVARDR